MKRSALLAILLTIAGGGPVMTVGPSKSAIGTDSVPPAFVAACGHPGSAVVLHEVPVTVPTRHCRLDGVAISYRGMGGTVGKGGVTGIADGVIESVSVTIETHSGSVTVDGDPATTTATNRGLADNTVRYLLGLAGKPPGAVADKALRIEPMESTAARSVANLSVTYRVPMAAEALLGWLRAHPPQNLHLSGSARDGEGGGMLDYNGFEVSGIESSDLEFTVVPRDASSAALRVDASAVWRDTTPLPDSASGRRLRVTVSGGCPAGIRSVVGVSNDGSFGDALLPNGLPSRALVCRYAGPGGPASHRLLSTAATRKLVSAIGQLDLAHAVGVVEHCPQDVGSATVVAISYPGRPDVDLWYAASGCRYLGNGHVIAEQQPGFDAVERALG